MWGILMLIKRATNDTKYKKYCNEESYVRNLSYVCTDENDNVLASCDFMILNQENAEIENYCLYKDDLLNKKILDEFIAEFSYWNPFIKTVYYKDNVFNMCDTVNIFKLPILDIQVEQLTVSKSKLNNALSWIKSKHDVIICVIKIDDKYVCIDGYSRLVAAYLKGYSYVYCYLEKDEYDEEDYKEYLRWCKDENVYTVKDLVNRIVSDEEHQRLWIDRCQHYLKNK
jgi:hypothetical protein